MTIAYVGKNTRVFQSGDVSPATISYTGLTLVAGQKLLLQVISGSTTNDPPTTPSDGTGANDWALVPGGGIVGGDPAAYSTNAGPRRVTFYEKIVGGSEPADFSLAWDSDGGGGAGMGAQIFQFSKTEATWDTTAATVGEDTTVSTGAGSFDVASSGTLAMAPGDMVVVGSGCSADNLLSAPVLSATGITFANVTDRESIQNDGRSSHQLTTADVSAGTGTPAIGIVLDHLGDPGAGVSVFMRLREVSGSPPPPPAPPSYPMRTEMYF